jgi:hypothetical protein
MHKTISTPSPFTSSSSFLVWGLASAMMTQAMQSKRKTNGVCLKVFFQEPMDLTFRIDEIITLPCRRDCLLKYHQPINGNSNNNHNNQGWAKSIFLK